MIEVEIKQGGEVRTVMLEHDEIIIGRRNEMREVKMQAPAAMFDKDAIDKALTKIKVTPQEENKKWVDEQLATVHNGSVVSLLFPFMKFFDDVEALFP